MEKETPSKIKSETINCVIEISQDGYFRVFLNQESKFIFEAKIKTIEPFLTNFASSKQRGTTLREKNRILKSLPRDIARARHRMGVMAEKKFKIISLPVGFARVYYSLHDKLVFDVKKHKIVFSKDNTYQVYDRQNKYIVKGEYQKEKDIIQDIIGSEAKQIVLKFVKSKSQIQTEEPPIYQAQDIKTFFAQIIRIEKDHILANFCVNEQKLEFQFRSIDADIFDGVTLKERDFIKTTISTSKNQRVFKYTKSGAEEAKILFEPNVNDFLPHFDQYQSLLTSKSEKVYATKEFPDSKKSDFDIISQKIVYAQIEKKLKNEVIALYLMDEEARTFQEKNLQNDVLKGLRIKEGDFLKITITTRRWSRIYQYEKANKDEIAPKFNLTSENLLPNLDKYIDLLVISEK